MFRFREDNTYGDKSKERVVEQRRAMKPQVGDVVDYMNERYVVAAVGNRICRMYKQGGNPNQLTVARLDMVLKVAP